MKFSADHILCFFCFTINYFLFFVLCWVLCNQVHYPSIQEDTHLNITQLTRKYGYPAQTHEVTTEDGYMLTVFRIPSTGPAVFLMHGLFCSADDFITAGTESGLAYLLAKEGFDVWLGNARGNKHSRKHVLLSPDENKASFWNFSWDEIGRYDLPAMIDHVLLSTHQPNLKYIGHAQGTTSFFVMASERPDYNDKISLMVALSPVAIMKHTKNPLVRFISSFDRVLNFLGNLIDVYEFIPKSQLLEMLQHNVCKHKSFANLLCNNVMHLISGNNEKQLNYTTLPVIFTHFPSGVSTKQILHYAQEVKSGYFRKYDYYSENKRQYGSILPPNYEVNLITAPVALFYSVADWFTNYTDVSILKERMPNVVDFYKIPDEGFSHMDFVYAKDYKTLIFSRLLPLLKSAPHKKIV